MGGSNQGLVGGAGTTKETCNPGHVPEPLMPPVARIAKGSSVAFFSRSMSFGQKCPC